MSKKSSKTQSNSARKIRIRTKSNLRNRLEHLKKLKDHLALKRKVLDQARIGFIEKDVRKMFGPESKIGK